MKEEINKAVEFLKLNDPIMHKIIVKVGPCTLTPSDSYFINLMRSVISQQLSLYAARTIWTRFEVITDQNFNPRFILNIDKELLRGAGLSYQKVNSVKEVSRFFIENPLISEKMKIMTDEEIIQTLTLIKGIGIWSAQMFLIFSLCRLNVLPLSDTGLKRSVMIHYLNQTGMGSRLLLDLSQKWGGYSTIACWYLWKALEV